MDQFLNNITLLPEQIYVAEAKRAEMCASDSRFWFHFGLAEKMAQVFFN